MSGSAFDPGNADCLDLYVADRIQRSDAERQAKTAVEIARRLEGQPGLVLADEVGMGKTFVALAVAAAAHFGDPERRPVVVMVPPALADKWPRDAGVFRSRCLKSPWREEFSFTEKPLTNGIDLLKTFDDAGRRKQNSIVFVTHGALYRSMSDGWVKLAILRKALDLVENDEAVRKALARFAGDIVRMGGYPEELFEGLLRRDPEQWLGFLHEPRFEKYAPRDDDDPVPLSLWRAINQDESLDKLRKIADQLRDMPLRKSLYIKDRIKELRRDLSPLIDDFWLDLKGRLDLKLPLLVFDEAHHLKNAETRLVRTLFLDNSNDDSAVKGTFHGVFSRMLFLTATPFQLGHHELINVLRLFESVDWDSSRAAGLMSRESYRERILDLQSKLDRAQEEALRLDQAWGRLSLQDLRLDGEGPEGESSWYAAALAGKAALSESGAAAVRQAERTNEAMRAAESLLAPWIIRHMKERRMKQGEGFVPRRIAIPGRGIAEPDAGDVGLTIGGKAKLPFLLAARTVAMDPRGRAVYAEGLASSYETFLNTHRNNLSDGDIEEGVDAAPRNERVGWYADAIEDLLSSSRSKVDRMPHPKIEATTKKALDLWKAGEKVAVFCYYVETGRALRRSISKAIHDCYLEKARAQWPGIDDDGIDNELENIGKRFFDGDSPARRGLDGATRSMIQVHEASGALLQYEERLVEILRRFVRTPSFLVRYFSLGTGIDEGAVARALRERNGSGLTIAAMFSAFLDFIAKRCSPEEADEYLTALSSVQTGAHRLKAAEALAGEELMEGALPNVRLVNGKTGAAARKTLMLTFNTPFFPEILIASAVLSEGVDLHLNCRHVIHHDLSWNPSTVEQRTGRIDRINAKAERCGLPIEVYLPYIAGTQDEKMYRVMTDRERWFKIVMGEELGVDSATIDAIAGRVPLPAALAERLAFRLEC